MASVTRRLQRQYARCREPPQEDSDERTEGTEGTERTEGTEFCCRGSAVPSGLDPTKELTSQDFILGYSQSPLRGFQQRTKTRKPTAQRSCCGDQATALPHGGIAVRIEEQTHGTKIGAVATKPPLSRGRGSDRRTSPRHKDRCRGDQATALPHGGIAVRIEEQAHGTKIVPVATRYEYVRLR